MRRNVLKSSTFDSKTNMNLEQHFKALLLI